MQDFPAEIQAGRRHGNTHNTGQATLHLASNALETKFLQDILAIGINLKHQGHCD